MMLKVRAMNDDLIKRSDAIAEIYKVRTPDVVSHHYAELFINAVRRAPSADRPQEWIPCSERLPSEKDYIGDVVIWCTDKSIVGVGWYYESTKSWATIDDTFPPILGEVIAWMPLPKPYEEVKENE